MYIQSHQPDQNIYQMYKAKNRTASLSYRVAIILDLLEKHSPRLFMLSSTLGLFFASVLCWCALQQEPSMFILYVSIFGKGSEYGFKYTCLSPFGKTFVYGVLVFIDRRQTFPRGIHLESPKDAIDRITNIIKRTLLTFDRQIWINPVPLFICQIASPGDW